MVRKNKKRILIICICTALMVLLISSFGLGSISNAVNSNMYSHRKIYDGVVYHNLEMVKEGLEDGDNINKVKIGAFTSKNPLWTSLEENQDKIAEFLIKKGADVNYYDGQTNISLLMSRAYSTDIYFTEILLKYGAKINQLDKTGSTALDFALRAPGENSTEENINKIVTLLLSNGAKITPGSFQCVLDGSKISSHCRYGLARRILEESLKAGSKPDIDPVLEAAILGESSEADKLINAGKMKEENKQDILFYTAAFGKTDTMDLLLKKGAKLNSRDKNNNTLLYVAARYGQVEMIDYLLNNGINIEDKNSDGDTALMAAIDNDQYKAAQFLINKGASVRPYKVFSEIKDALEDSAGKGNINMMKLIIANGYPLNKNNMAKAFLNAAIKDQIDAMKYLLANGADADMEYNGSTALEACCRGMNTETVKFLVDSGAKINGKNGYGEPLYYAAYYGEEDTVKYLIEKGADVNAVAPSDSKNTATKGYSPLMAAAKNGYLDIVKLLIDKGADLEYQNEKDHNNTVIILSAGGGSRHISEYLIKKGAKINYKNKEGETALMYAVEHQQLDNVKQLLKYKADTKLKNNKGQTALDTEKEYLSKNELSRLTPNNEILKILEKIK